MLYGSQVETSIVELFGVTEKRGKKMGKWRNGLGLAVLSTFVFLSMLGIGAQAATVPPMGGPIGTGEPLGPGVQVFTFEDMSRDFYFTLEVASISCTTAVSNLAWSSILETIPVVAGVLNGLTTSYSTDMRRMARGAVAESGESFAEVDAKMRRTLFYSSMLGGGLSSLVDVGAWAFGDDRFRLSNTAYVSVRHNWRKITTDESTCGRDVANLRKIGNYLMRRLMVM